MQKKTLTILLSITGILIMVFGILFFCIINSKDIIKGYISAQYGFDVEIENAKISPDLAFNINFRAQRVLFLDENEKVIEINNPDIKFSLLNLIFRKINIQRANIKNIYVFLKRDNKGKFNISFLNDIKTQDLKNFKFKKINSNIELVQIDFRDDYKLNVYTKAALYNTSLDYSLNTLKKFTQQGKILIKTNNFENTSDLKFDIQNSNYDIKLKNFTLDYFSSLLRNHISKDIERVHGVCDLSLNSKEEKFNFSLLFKNFGFDYKDRVKTLYDKLSINALFSFDKNTLLFDDIELLGQNTNIKIKGEIEKPLSDKRKTNIETIIKNTEINNFTDLLPDNLMYYNLRGIPTLKKSNFHAILDGKIKFSDNPIDFTGSLKLSDIHIPNYPKPYRQNNVNLLFSGDKLRVYTRIYTPQDEYVTVDGYSNLDNSLFGKYSVKSTKKIDLAFAQMYLVPVGQIIGFNIGPLPMMNVKGFGNIDIQAQGTPMDGRVFGVFEGYNAQVQMDGIYGTIKDASCRFVFDNRDLYIKNLKGILDGAQFNLSGKTNNLGDVNLNIKLKNALTSKVLKLLENSSLSQKYKVLTKRITAVSGKIDIDFNLKGNVKNFEDVNFLSLLEHSGNFEIKNNKIFLKDMPKFNNISGRMNFGEKQDGVFEILLGSSKINAEFKIPQSLSYILKGSLFELVCHIKGDKIFFHDLNNKIADIDFISKADINLKLKTTTEKFDPKSINMSGFISSLNTVYNKNIRFKNGFIKIVQNKARFENFTVDFLEGSAVLSGFVDFSNKLNTDILFTSTLSEKFCDFLINPYLTYPLKIKGEIPLKGRLRGVSSDYSVDFLLDIPKKADIFYSGANISDTNWRREIEGRLISRSNKVIFDNLRLIKYLENDKGKIVQIPVIRVLGQVLRQNSEFYYNNLKIISQNPANVRMLNLVFKKSILKDGEFICNLILDGNTKAPLIKGTADVFNLDIPLYDTKIKEIKANANGKITDLTILANNKNSDLKGIIRLENKFTPPYILDRFYINSNILNIEDLIKSLPDKASKMDVSAPREVLIEPKDIIIKDGAFNFKNVSYEKIEAQNLKGNFSYNNSLFNLKNIQSEIAQGLIRAKGSYSLKNKKLLLEGVISECSANTLTQGFLNLNNQIFGKLNGEIKLSAKDLDTPQGIKTIKSSLIFEIKEGKMPKLGSLEYLLAAGNLFKSGLLGLSLNNLIQVLTPYKTGEFDLISGSLDIEEGKVQNLVLKSKGKNLSLYSEGTYDILSNFADINIYGRLSQNVSNALGSVANASIKRFITSIVPNNHAKEDDILREKLNNIPSLNNDTKDIRYFSAKVSGDINKDNYIKNFKWE